MGPPLTRGGWRGGILLWKHLLAWDRTVTASGWWWLWRLCRCGCKELCGSWSSLAHKLLISVARSCSLPRPQLGIMGSWLPEWPSSGPLSCYPKPPPCGQDRGSFICSMWGFPEAGYDCSLATVALSPARQSGYRARQEHTRLLPGHFESLADSVAHKSWSWIEGTIISLWSFFPPCFYWQESLNTNLYFECPIQSPLLEPALLLLDYARYFGFFFLAIGTA